MNLEKIEVKIGKANVTFLHWYLTPEARTVEKNKKYKLVTKYLSVFSTRNSCIIYFFPKFLQ